MGNNVKQFRIIVLKIRKKDRFLKKADPHGYGYMESFTERDPGSFVVFPVDFLQYGKYFWVSDQLIVTDDVKSFTIMVHVSDKEKSTSGNPDQQKYHSYGYPGSSQLVTEKTPQWIINCWYINDYRKIKFQREQHTECCQDVKDCQ